MASIFDMFISISGDNSSFKRSIKESGDELVNFESTVTASASRLEAVGKRLLGSIGFGAIGAGAFVAAQKFDEASVQIQRSTGATGDKLKSLSESFTNVYKTSTASSTQVADALSIIATRTGATGAALEDLTRKTIQLSKTQREDVTALVPLVTRMFGDWSISLQNTGKSMDFLRVVSQQTGSKVADISQLLVYAGAPLRQLGYDFERAATLIGKFQKEGVNTELVLGAMKAILGKFAKEGITDTAAAWQDFTEQVRKGNIGLSQIAQTAGEFGVGRRAAVDLFRAVVEGRFQIDDTVKSYEKLAATGGDSVETLRGKLTKFQHQVESLASAHKDLIVAVGLTYPVWGGMASAGGAAISGLIMRLVGAGSATAAIATVSNSTFLLGGTFTSVGATIATAGATATAGWVAFLGPIALAVAGVTALGLAVRQIPKFTTPQSSGGTGKVSAPIGGIEDLSRIDFAGFREKLQGLAPAAKAATVEITDAQKALTALGLKSTEERKKDLESAKKYYEDLKKAGEGQQVIAEAALKVKQAQEALTGTLEKGTGAYHAMSTAVKKYSDSLSEMLVKAQSVKSDASIRGLVEGAARAGEFSAKPVSLQGYLAGLQSQFDSLGNAIAPQKSIAEALGAAIDKDGKVIKELGGAIAEIGEKGLGDSTFGKLADSAEYFGITTQHAAEMAADTAVKKFDQMLQSGVATDRELGEAALKTAQIEIDADLRAGRISAERHAQESRAIQEDLAQYTGATKKKVTLQEQIAAETKRMTASMFNSLERGLASDIVHWKGFGATIKSVFQTLGEDILTIMIHALLKPVEKLFADVLAGIAEKLLGVFITQKVAGTAVTAGEVAQDAAVGGAAAAASIAAIPIVGPALALEAGLAMYGSILGTFMPLVLAGASAKGGLGEVPFDGFQATLHRQETVLPADIAVPLRAQLRAGGVGGGGISFPNCTFNGVTRETVGAIGNMLIRQARMGGARI